MTGTIECGKSAKRPPTVALGITGSIAAFKAVEIVRLLMSRGVRVIPVLTTGGAKFVGPVVFTGICREPARMDMWDPRFAGEMHIDLAQQADLIVVAPATADVLARFAQGRADDLLTALVLAFQGRVLIAPAMHPNMWAHPATQRNCRVLSDDGRVEFVGPVVGKLANGDVGLGRMADPANIADAVMKALAQRHEQAVLPGVLHGDLHGDLNGVRVVVTAGPTVEDLDPVRFITNRSSGKMGFAIAQQAARRGGVVTLVTGPVHLATPAGVRRVDVRSARDMSEALDQLLGSDMQGADALVMAAAVGDFRAAKVLPQKMSRSAASQNESVHVELVANPDILATLGARRKRLQNAAETQPLAQSTSQSPSQPRLPVLIGFAVQTGSHDDLVAKAIDKLRQKQVDMVVGNLASVAFGADSNEAVFAQARHGDSGEADFVRLDRMSKSALADRILDALVLMRKGSSRVEAAAEVIACGG